MPGRSTEARVRGPRRERVHRPFHQCVQGQAATSVVRDARCRRSWQVRSSGRCGSWTRLTRNFNRGGDILRRIDEAGVKLVSVTEQIDTSTPIGKAIVGFQIAQAETEVREHQQAGCSQAQYVGCTRCGRSRWQPAIRLPTGQGGSKGVFSCVTGSRSEGIEDRPRVRRSASSPASLCAPSLSG